MIPLQTFETYAPFAADGTKSQPEPAKYAAGFQQSDVLPAEWMNWAWNKNTVGITDLNRGVTSIENEVLAVLTEANMTACEATTNQLVCGIVSIINKCNAGTACKLKTAKAINGTNFDGSAAITTSCWGTARNISISDSDGTNTGTAVSVNGSAAATLKLPATIKANLSGKATNSTCFDGCTYACAKADILTGCAADSAKFAGCNYSQARTDIRDGLAPTNHATTATTYGAGNATNYGHVKVCDNYASSGGCAAGSVAASSCAVYNAYEQGRCLGNAKEYLAASINPTGEAGEADCYITIGQARSYRWSNCPTNVCSFDRRTYTTIGTHQNQNEFKGYTYIETYLWQCCYSGSAEETQASNRRFCFASDGFFYSPVGIATGTVCAKSSNFGTQLIVESCTGGNSAITFKNCTGTLGYMAISAADARFMRYNSTGANGYTILDTSTAVTITQGGTGAANAADARTNLGLGTAAVCAASAFRSCTWEPNRVHTTSDTSPWFAYINYNSSLGRYCLDVGHETYPTGGTRYGIQVAYANSATAATSACCASCNGSGVAFGTAATCAATDFRACTWEPNRVRTTSDTTNPWYIYTNFNASTNYYCMDVSIPECPTGGNRRYGIQVAYANSSGSASSATIACCAKCNSSGVAFGTAAVCDATAFLGATACACDSEKFAGCTFTAACNKILEGTAHCACIADSVWFTLGALSFWNPRYTCVDCGSGKCTYTVCFDVCACVAGYTRIMDFCYEYNRGTNTETAQAFCACQPLAIFSDECPNGNQRIDRIITTICLYCVKPQCYPNNVIRGSQFRSIKLV